MPYGDTMTDRPDENHSELEHELNIELDPSVRYSAPELAMAHDLSRAAVHGSPRIKRRARMIVFVILGMPAIAMVIYALGELL